MQSVSLHYRVGEDGIIHLDIPIGLTNAELQVTVTFQTFRRQKAAMLKEPTLKNVGLKKQGRRISCAYSVKYIFIILVGFKPTPEGFLKNLPSA